MREGKSERQCVSGCLWAEAEVETRDKTVDSVESLWSHCGQAPLEKLTAVQLVMLRLLLLFVQ